MPQKRIIKIKKVSSICSSSSTLPQRGIIKIKKVSSIYSRSSTLPQKGLLQKILSNGVFVLTCFFLLYLNLVKWMWNTLTKLKIKSCGRNVSFVFIKREEFKSWGMEPPQRLSNASTSSGISRPRFLGRFAINSATKKSTSHPVKLQISSEVNKKINR